MMKIAIVHDSLAEFGGAERVLQVLFKIFPNAHLFTGFADPDFLTRFFPNVSKKRIHFSMAQAFHPFFIHHTHLFQSLAPFIWSHINLTGYDIVIANTSYIMSGLVIAPPGALFIQYVQTLPKNLFHLEPPSRFQKLLPYRPVIIHALRKSLSATPHVIAISEHIKHMLKDFVYINPSVIHPPVRVPVTPIKKKLPSYYLCVSRLDNAKGLEIAITACTRLNLPLKIVGVALDENYGNYLRSLAGPTIEFLGFKSDREIQSLYQRAIAFIFTSKSEDFGIAPIEAMAHGVPVIAYYGGGAKETITDRTGVFFKQYNSAALTRILENFQPQLFNPRELRLHANKFSEEKFKKKFRDYITSAIAQRRQG